MENKNIVAAIEALGEKINNLELDLMLKDLEIKELKKKLAEKEATDGKD